MSAAGQSPTARSIGLDARYLSHGLVGGVHTYVRELAARLARVAPGRRWVLYADAKAPFELTDLPAGVTVRTLSWRNGASSVQNDLRLGRLMARDGVEVAHFPANYGFAPARLPLAITLHDAINLLPWHEIIRDDSKQPRHLALMAYLHWLTTVAVRRRPAPLIITVSHYSRREILRHSALPSDQVHVVYSGYDPAFRPLAPDQTADLRARLGLRPRVLLADAIKNPACTLRGYRALPADVRDQTSLAFFARRPPAAAVQAAADAGECLLLHRPPRDELIALYHLADFFVFPSWYEGFGLPALEAMACGTPVIASDRGSLPEVVGAGGVTTDAEDHAAIAAAITQFFTQPDAYARLCEHAAQQAAGFSWEQTARETVALYDEAWLRAGARAQSSPDRARSMTSWR
ncbi:MAG: glycosyltransferase family 4 protein [Thermomicrobiales bacterium]